MVSKCVHARAYVAMYLYICVYVCMYDRRQYPERAEEKTGSEYKSDASGMRNWHVLQFVTNYVCAMYFRIGVCIRLINERRCVNCRGYNLQRQRRWQDHV
jgi:hypothetical protein